jgi:hypothetical protein
VHDSKGTISIDADKLFRLHQLNDFFKAALIEGFLQNKLILQQSCKIQRLSPQSIQSYFGLDDILMPKATHRHRNNGLMEEDMSESVAVVGECEQLGEATLIKAELHLEHILL